MIVLYGIEVIKYGRVIKSNKARKSSKGFMKELKGFMIDLICPDRIWSPHYMYIQKIVSYYLYLYNVQN